MAIDEFGDTIAEGAKTLKGPLSAEKEPMLLLDTTDSMHRISHNTNMVQCGHTFAGSQS